MATDGSSWASVFDDVRDKQLRDKKNAEAVETIGKKSAEVKAAESKVSE